MASQTRFLQRDCEETGFPDASLDACLCSCMLNHLDLARALPELQRIMKPSGRADFAEPLSYNPWHRSQHYCRRGVCAGRALPSATIAAVVTRIPGLRLWSWQFTFELVKVDRHPLILL